MSDQSTPHGLEPLSDVTLPGMPARHQSRQDGVRLNIRGRSVKLRGLRRHPKGIWRWLLILGPGLIASAAGNDAGGIATYSSAGAKYGYDLIWVMIVVTVSLMVVQEMCARLGAATGRGLLDLIRERFGLGWSLFAMTVVMIANGGLIITEFVGIGAAAELLGVSKYIVVPLAAALLWYLVIYGSYGWVEKIFIVMTMVFFAYPVAAIMAHPNWGDVARGAFIPRIHLNSDYIIILVGLLGTTVTPYMQLYQQSAVVEKGVARDHYGPERVDTYTGVIFSNLMSISMIIATAAAIYMKAGPRDLASAADAAQALKPAVGNAATALFSVGLLGASLLAGAVLPLATAYAVSETFGFPKGVNLDFRRARIFFGLFTLLIVFGAGLALIPNVPVIKLLVWTQVLNGVLLPIILVFVMLLINDERLTGKLKNTRFYNILGWGTVAMISLAVLTLLGSQLLDLLGIHLFGG